MTNLQNEMTRLVNTFVADVADLAQRAAREQLHAVFDKVRPLNGARGGGGGGGRSLKRSVEDLDQIAAKFHAFVAANPGLRIEQINKQIGTTTKDLQLPIRKMIAEGAIKVKGSKRSTTYSAGKKA